jgi:hypothetical protein
MIEYIKVIKCSNCSINDNVLVDQRKSTAFIDNKWVTIESHVVMCNNCGLVYNETIPSQESLKYIYRKLSRSARGDNPNHVQNILSQVDFIKEYIPKNSTVIDVGSAFSQFTELVSEGRTVYTLEPSESLSKTVVDDKKVIYGMIEDFKSDIKFDLICFRHLIEHLSQPKATLEKFRSNLSLTGKIFIEIPLIEYAKPIGIQSWFNFLHLHHFSRKSFVSMANNAGYRICRFEKTNYGAGRFILELGSNQIESEMDYDTKNYIVQYHEREAKSISLVRRKIESALSDSPIIYLWGAGFHSEALINLIPYLKSAVSKIIDSDKDKWGSQFYGIDVISPSEVEEKYPIIISSIVSQEAIKTDAKNILGDKNRLITLYEYETRY